MPQKTARSKEAVQGEAARNCVWIELWNRGTLPVDLGGYGLSDRLANPFKWVFIPDAVVAPGDFLVVHASGKDRQPILLPSLAPGEVPGLRTWLRADAVNPSDPAHRRGARVRPGKPLRRGWCERSAVTTEGATEWLSIPSLSHEGGFYTEAFDLVLEHPDPEVEIRYTLNGDEPTPESPL